MFLAGALLLGAAAGYWLGGSQATGEYTVKLDECGAEVSELENRVDYLQKGPGMAPVCPAACGPEKAITTVNLRFEEYAEGMALETRNCARGECTSTYGNTEYYEWGYQGVNYRGGEAKVVEAPAAVIESGSPSGKALLFNSKYADPSDAPDGVDNQGGNRVIHYFGQEFEDVEIEFDLLFGTDEDHSEDDYNFDLLTIYVGEDYEAFAMGEGFDPEANHWVNGLPVYITGPRFGDGLRGEATSADAPYPWMRMMANKYEASSIYSFGESWSNGEAVFEYETGNWYHVKIVTDSEEGTYQLSIGGSTTVYRVGESPILPTQGGIGSFEQIVVGDPGSGQETDLQEVYIDNLVVKTPCRDEA